MNEYLLILYGGLDFSTATAEQAQQTMNKWQTWIDEQAAAGHFKTGERLSPNAKLVKEGGAITDGPFAEGKEVIGGFIIVKADSLEQAAKIATGCPIYEHNGYTEVREIVKM